MKTHRKVIKNRFYIIEDLGQGGYGSVHKAIDKATNEMVAVKYGPFSMETVCLIGLQLVTQLTIILPQLERLENFHNIGYIHLDLKPDNILLGSSNTQSNKQKMLYLIDFGVSRKYKSPDGSHVQFKMDLPFTGNIIFASVNSFLNYEIFSQLFNYVRHLDFEQKPDYSYFRKGLKSVLEQINPISIKPVLDWMMSQKVQNIQYQCTLQDIENRNSHLKTQKQLSLKNNNQDREDLIRQGSTKQRNLDPDQPQTPGIVSKRHGLGGDEKGSQCQTPLLRPQKLKYRGKQGTLRKKRKGKKSRDVNKSRSGLIQNDEEDEEAEGEGEDDQNDDLYSNFLVPRKKSTGPKSQILGVVKGGNIMLTPNLQKSNLMDRRRRMAVLGMNDNIQNLNKNLVTLKHATIYEVSAMDRSHIDQNRYMISHINNESFEVDFDSAEFNDQNIDEGQRNNQDYEFQHNENYIKKPRPKFSSKRNIQPFPIISFF
ncbi:serine threonine protein kinase [Stylonychia lemnae]|uniref:Casein kinase I n=1 Tax=Stylonychia lemnae TaxID=5949 RepID=A0A078B4A3_STYLE|nr:serine threonine protein kinase [Stylonychia lemnae]|eukprot:CDW89304.1 serine threonine protein kinase [Stylonychia lemnae]